MSIEDGSAEQMMGKLMTKILFVLRSEMMQAKLENITTLEFKLIIFKCIEI